MGPLKHALLGWSVVLASWASAQEGALDPTFNPGDVGYGQGTGANGGVRDMVIQQDGKAVICGGFTYYHAVGCGRIARLNADASLDAGFNTGTGANDYVYALATQPDGKILMGGIFTQFNGTPRNRFARLNTNGGLDLFYSVNLNGAVNGIAVQPDGKVLVCGQFTLANGASHNGLVRLNTDGSLDPGFNTGTGASTITSVALQPDGKIMIGGAFTSYNGSAVNRIARLNPDGSLDAGFDSGTGANDIVRVVDVLPGDKILVGGDFTTFNGESRNSLARLNANGALDTSFDPGTGANGFISNLVVQPDGKVIVGGGFTTFNGLPRLCIARLQANGMPDTAFSPSLTGGNAYVHAVALQSDGRILIGGDFTSYNGAARSHIARANTDGGLDGTYAYVTGVNGLVVHLVAQPDGKILCGGYFNSYFDAPHVGIVRLNSDGSADDGFAANLDVGSIQSMLPLSDGRVMIGGSFTSINGVLRKNLALLNPDGSLDTGFDPGVGPDYWPNASAIGAMVMQPDGRLIIAGSFTSFNGLSRNRIARLNADGTLDATFNPGTGANASIQAVALQPDGRILIAGAFSSYNGTTRNAIARLNANGSLDSSFDPGTGTLDINNTAWIYSLAIQPDGKVIIGGQFTKYNGVTRYGVARVNANGSLDTGFNYVTGGAPGSVYCVRLLPDGRILITGTFNTYNGVARNKIARVNANGSLDATFNPGTGANSEIRTCVVQQDGSIVIGGDFVSYNGIGRNRLARVNGTARSNIRVMFEGPFNAGQMNDALRTLPSFPLTEPFTAMGYANAAYTPGASIAASVLAATGPNAIVDWVIVEMRPSVTSSFVAASRAVLLQRDGDIVDLDGVSSVGFAGLAHGDYCVAVKPRTHLPVMLSPSTPFAYGTSTAPVDFTSASTLVYDDDARVNLSGTMVLATGDASFNEELKYVGNGNDRDSILLRVGGSTPSATVSGYWPEDVNMDGVVKYTGANNDRDPILVNIGGSTPNAVRNAQLP